MDFTMDFMVGFMVGFMEISGVASTGASLEAGSTEGEYRSIHRLFRQEGTEVE